MLTAVTSSAGVATAAESVDLHKMTAWTVTFYFSLSLILAVLHAVWLLSPFSPTGFCELSALEALLPSPKISFSINCVRGLKRNRGNSWQARHLISLLLSF